MTPDRGGSDHGPRGARPRRRAVEETARAVAWRWNGRPTAGITGRTSSFWGSARGRHAVPLTTEVGVLAHLELALLYPAPRTKRVAAGNGHSGKAGSLRYAYSHGIGAPVSSPFRVRAPRSDWGRAAFRTSVTRRIVQLVVALSGKATANGGSHRPPRERLAACAAARGIAAIPRFVRPANLSRGEDYGTPESGRSDIGRRCRAKPWCRPLSVSPPRCRCSGRANLARC
jgi:hypothetical protein